MKKPINNFSNIFVIFLITSTAFLLVPSSSGLGVFSGGSFLFIESIGLILLFLTLIYLIARFTYTKLSLIKTINKFYKLIFPLILIATNSFMLISIIGLIWIKYEVKSLCREAVMTYGGDCVIAAKAMLEDNNQSYASRNKAVWTLGQLADIRALPVLKKYYTGKIPGRESLHHTLSQYELKKAIKWCEEGNITSWLYF